MLLRVFQSPPVSKDSRVSVCTTEILIIITGLVRLSRRSSATWLVYTNLHNNRQQKSSACCFFFLRFLQHTQPARWNMNLGVILFIYDWYVGIRGWFWDLKLCISHQTRAKPFHSSAEAAERQTRSRSVHKTAIGSMQTGSFNSATAPADPCSFPKTRINQTIAHSSFTSADEQRENSSVLVSNPLRSAQNKDRK